MGDKNHGAGRMGRYTKQVSAKVATLILVNAILKYNYAIAMQMTILLLRDARAVYRHEAFDRLKLGE